MVHGTKITFIQQLITVHTADDQLIYWLKDELFEFVICFQFLFKTNNPCRMKALQDIRIMRSANQSNQHYCCLIVFVFLVRANCYALYLYINNVIFYIVIAKMFLTLTLSVYQPFFFLICQTILQVNIIAFNETAQMTKVCNSKLFIANQRNKDILSEFVTTMGKSGGKY